MAKLGTVRVHFKTPDACHHAVEDMLDQHQEEIRDRDVRADLLRQTEKILDKFIQYGECITVEIDLDAGTAKVLPAK